MTNNLCTETGYISLNHVGEQLCGDRVEIVDKAVSYTHLDVYKRQAKQPARRLFPLR